jgi:imidazolonepropionase-like amidohydrolase
LILLFASTVAGAPPADPAAIAVIHDVTIIDVEAGRAVPHQSVLIRGEAIVAIEAAATFVAPEGARFVDGSNRYLLPGLFDAHVHISASPDTFAPLLLAHGVTCVRDTGADTRMILDLRRRAADRSIDCPRIICTGAIIDGDPPYWPFSEACDTPEEARAAVLKLHEAGVDQIKVYSRLRPEVYRAAVEEAKAVGLKPVGHVPDAVPLQDAVATGQACIEHFTGFERLLAGLAGQRDDNQTEEEIWKHATGFLLLDKIPPRRLQPVIESMRKAGTVHCPTIVMMAGIGRGANAEDAGSDPRMEFVPPALHSVWSAPGMAEFGDVAGAAVDSFVRLARMLHDAGITLMVGTDLANPYVFAGSSVHEEMQFFAQAGIPNADVLRAATIVPARFCEVDNQLGSIVRGKEASLVLLRRNPLDDIAAVKEIESVVHRGRVLDRAALDQMLDAVRARVKSAQPAVADVNLDLPGELLHQGRYVVKFQQFDAGDELFAIARVDDGYVIKSHSRPQGGYMPPSALTLEVEPDFTFRAAAWRQLTQPPVDARYELTADGFRATATSATEALEPQTMAIPEQPWLMWLTSYASQFAALNKAALQVGETREFQAVSFGLGSWNMLTSALTITRHEDMTVTINERERAARRYTSTLSTRGGDFPAETWADENNLLLKYSLTLPSGTVTVTLDER